MTAPPYHLFTLDLNPEGSARVHVVATSLQAAIDLIRERHPHTHIRTINHEPGEVHIATPAA